jgi:hypothetical protein
MSLFIIRARWLNRNLGGLGRLASKVPFELAAARWKDQTVSLEIPLPKI